MARNTQNKRGGKVIAGLGFGIAFLLLTLIVFTVDTTEYAVVTQFGNPVAVIMEPGLNVKLPEPIQTVQRLDNRIVETGDNLGVIKPDLVIGIVGESCDYPQRQYWSADNRRCGKPPVVILRAYVRCAAYGVVKRKPA